MPIRSKPRADRSTGRWSSRWSGGRKRLRLPPTRRIRPTHSIRRLIEPSGGVGQHGVDLAGLRGEIGARQRLAAIVARDLLEQPLELADIAVDRAHEVAVGAVLAADLVERLLALHGVELARKHVAFAAVVALPQLGRRLVIDHAR